MKEDNFESLSPLLNRIVFFEAAGVAAK